MTNWKEYILGDVISVKHGYGFKGEFFSETPTNDLLLTPGNFYIGGGFKSGKLKYFKGDYPKEYILSEGDIIITMTDLSKEGDTLGYSAQIPAHKDIRYLHNQRIGLMQLKSQEFSREFLYWLLRTRTYQEFIVSSATGTTVRHTSPTRIYDYKFKAPNLETQTAIAEILSSLDNKIEINNQINQNLDALAQALFKQWFVDFEFPDKKGNPYKSSGGKMMESELGEIPQGWKVYSMDELLETVSKTYPLKKVKEVVFLNTGDILDGKFLHKNFSNPENLPGQAKKSIAENDILYSEIRPANKRFAYVYFDASQYVVSTKLMVMRSKVEINSLFQYFYLTQQESIKYLQHLAESRSGTFPQITFSEVSTIKIALPDFELVNTFVEIALKPYYDNQFQVKDENEKLILLRDLILPKLMSGELEVKTVKDQLTTA